jgi:hypothetical protein
MQGVLRLLRVDTEQLEGLEQEPGAMQMDYEPFMTKQRKETV